jgi:predicted phage-related endonuclease
MKILDVVQGSPEWHAARGLSHGASEAPAMMGASSRCTRSELVRMKATGDQKEFSDWVRDNLLLRGHEVEDFARAEIEHEIGEDLYPGTATDDEDYLLASPDGATMDGTVGFECKLWNEELAAQVRASNLGPEWYWQLEQQIKVWGFEKIIFIVTDGTREKFLRFDYTAVPGRAQQLMAGWKQFDEDVANYQHVEVIPRAVAEPVKALPALLIDVKGEIELTSNLDKFGELLKAYIAGIPEKPATDQDFANCEAAITTLETAQKKLETAESNALAQFATIDNMRRTVAMYAELSRSTRLMLEKLVKARKDEIRDEIRRGGAEGFAMHITKLNERLGGMYMPIVPAKFADVMKGKKTITSLRDAVGTELARLKIESNEIADRIDLNLKALVEHAAGFEQLFPDKQQIVCKANDDFVNLVKSRIAEQKQKIEADRERIRQEEAAKAQAHAAPAAVPAAVPAPAAHAATIKGAGSPCRPSDDTIINVLANHFHIPESLALKWLLEMDLESASRRTASELAA